MHGLRQLSLFAPAAAEADAVRPNESIAALDPSAGERVEKAPDAPQRLRQRLGPLVDVPLASVVLTDNRQRIFSARPRRGDGALELRIHRSFVDADEDLLCDLGRFLSNRLDRAERRRVLEQVRRHHEAHASPARRRRQPLDPAGQTYDLQEIRDRINQQYFASSITVQITWGARRSTHRRQRSLRLGTYHAGDQLVRLHRCLDRPEVPLYVVESVVYHEMLHAAVPPRPGRVRRQVHSGEFRRRERLFAEHDAAQRWIAQHFGTLVAGC